MSGEAARLKALFERRDMMARQMAAIDKRIAAVGDAYRIARGYSVRPRIETLRKEVGL